MPAFPDHHVGRPRLSNAILGRKLSLIEAGGGYGKSVLIGELARVHSGPVVLVELATRSHDALSFVAALASAVSAAGFGLAELPPEPDAVISTLSEALRDSDALVVIDDAHILSSEATSLLVDFVRLLADHANVVIGARRLPEGAERLRPLAGSASITAQDLSLTSEEVGAIAESLGVPLAADQVAAVRDVTGGWPAACVLALLKLQRTDNTDRELARLAQVPTVLRFLLDESLAALDVLDSTMLAELAFLPTMSDQLVALAGRSGLLIRASEAGVPLTPRGDGWFEFPGPVNDQLRERGVLSGQVAQCASDAYLAAGELVAALHALLEGRLFDDVATTLSNCPAKLLWGIEPLELHDVVDRLPDACLRAHPRVMLILARQSDAPTGFVRRAHALQDAVRFTEPDTPLGREIQAEVARDVARDLRIDEARTLALAVLDAAGRDEIAARARAHDVLGQVYSWPADEMSLLQSAHHFEEAARLSHQLGETLWEASALRMLGDYVHFTAGRFEAALDAIDRALELAVIRPTTRLSYLTTRAEIRHFAGQHREALEDVDEVFATSARMHDHRVLGYGYWEQARNLASLGDADGTLEALRNVELHRGDWYTNQTGVYFLSDAADFCARLGLDAHAQRYLKRAQDRASEAPVQVYLATAYCAVWRRDSPVANEALELLESDLGGGGFETKDRWRYLLIRAYAMLLTGDESAGRVAAEAFDAAAALGIADLPVRNEPMLTKALVALATESGSPTAAVIDQRGARVVVQTFGVLRCTVGGAARAIPTGLPAQLLSCVIAHAGRVHAEIVTEDLWPDAEPGSGQTQLRKVLSRLKKGVEREGESIELVAREGDALVLHPDVVVDAFEFESDARAALTARDPVLGQAALARCRAEFLPADAFADWAVGPRERLRRLRIRLIEMLANDAAARGDFPNSLMNYDALLELEPDDEERYVAPAKLLVAIGRPAAALGYLRRAERAVGELGLVLSPVARAVQTGALRALDDEPDSS